VFALIGMLHNGDWKLLVTLIKMRRRETAGFLLCLANQIRLYWYVFYFYRARQSVSQFLFFCLVSMVSVVFNVRSG